MTNYQFDPDLLDGNTQLFPDTICDDPWILYHGTSSEAETQIENEGFFWAKNKISKSDIEMVVQIYRRMNWSGIDGGGFAVLEPFSLMHDFAEKSDKRIFFAETSCRALLYATHDFAGGETARALRKAIIDLERYQSSHGVREEHFNMLRYELKQTGAKGSHPPVPDSDWLQSELKKIERIRQLCWEPYDSYRYGLVYAVKLCIKDCQGLTHHKSMGIIASEVISPDKIVAKIVIPPNVESNRFRDDNRRINILVDKPGIFGVLDKLGAS